MTEAHGNILGTDPGGRNAIFDRKVKRNLRRYQTKFKGEILSVGVGVNEGLARIKHPADDVTIQRPLYPVIGKVVAGERHWCLLDAFGGLIIGAASSGPGQAIGTFSGNKANAQADIVSATFTKVAYEGEDFDVSGWYNPTLSRYTPQLAGYYRFSALVYISPAVDGARLAIGTWRNGVGTGTEVRMGEYHPASVSPIAVSGTGIMYANGSTDYFEVGLWHSFGVNTSDLLASVASKFQGSFLGTP
jgi:hypothetical protein